MTRTVTADELADVLGAVEHADSHRRVTGSRSATWTVTSTEGTVITRATSPLPSFWRCCADNPVAVVVMDAEDGVLVAYAACQSCQYGVSENRRAPLPADVAVATKPGTDPADCLHDEAARATSASLRIVCLLCLADLGPATLFGRAVVDTNAADVRDDRDGARIACHHAYHYGNDGLPLCKGDDCDGLTVACGQGLITCQRHAVKVAQSHDYRGGSCVRCGMDRPGRGEWAPSCADVQASFDALTVDEVVAPERFAPLVVPDAPRGMTTRAVTVLPGRRVVAGIVMDAVAVLMTEDALFPEQRAVFSAVERDGAWHVHSPRIALTPRDARREYDTRLDAFMWLAGEGA